MTRVKICGIKEKSHALAVVEAGGDFMGLVFAPSPRRVTLVQAHDIARVVKEHSSATAVVGVFVNAPAPEVNRIADACNLDWVQLSGDESWEYCRQITKPIIKAVRISYGQEPEDICANLATGARVLSHQKHAILLDSRVKDRYGGTGKTFDWALARPAAEQFPAIIAGGLTSENVAQAIDMVAPWGVDVSSGVEVDRVKDTPKIRAFIEAVRRTGDNQR